MALVRSYVSFVRRYRRYGIISLDVVLPWTIQRTVLRFALSRAIKGGNATRHVIAATRPTEIVYAGSSCLSTGISNCDDHVILNFR